MKKITLMIPCYNEEEGIAEVIKDTPPTTSRSMLDKEKIYME